MKAASSASHIPHLAPRNIVPFLSRRALASMAGALIFVLLGFAAAPDLRAETPPDQIKAAGGIPLTTELLDKMEKFVKSISTDSAAKAEMTEANKDPSITPETFGSVIAAKCPKTVEIFKASGLTPDEFSKGLFAIMAVAMSDDLAKSENKAVAANAAFVAANKDRANAVFSSFMMLNESAPGSSPAPTP